MLEPTAVSGVDLVLNVAFKPVIEIMGQAIDGLCGLLTSCNSMTCIKGVTSFEVTSPPRALLAGYYLLLLLFLSEEGRLLDPAETEESRSCTDLFMPGSSGDIRAGDRHRI